MKNNPRDNGSMKTFNPPPPIGPAPISNTNKSKAQPNPSAGARAALTDTRGPSSRKLVPVPHISTSTKVINTRTKSPISHPPRSLMQQSPPPVTSTEDLIDASSNGSGSGSGSGSGDEDPLEAQAQLWMEMILGEKLVPHDDLPRALQSGRVLCLLVNRLSTALNLSDPSAAPVPSSDVKKNWQQFERVAKVLELPQTSLLVPSTSNEPVLHMDNTLQARVSETYLNSSSSHPKLNMMELSESTTSLNAAFSEYEDLHRALSKADADASASANANANASERTKTKANGGSNTSIGVEPPRMDESTCISKWENILDIYEMQQKATHEAQEKDNKKNGRVRSSGHGALAYAAWVTEEKIRMLIRGNQKYGPLPSHLHGKLWLLLSGAKFEMHSNPGHFEELKSSPAFNEESDVTRQIDADISRTVSSEEDPTWTEAHIGQLRCVLLCYAAHNPKLGYCQGLNFIVARMLQFLNEEESFWLLIKMVKLLPDDYFTTMLGVAIDQHVFVDLVDLRHPQINAHLKKLGGSGMELTLACTEWFLTLFASPCPKEVTVRVWDAVFINGDEVLFQVALALMTLQARSILSCEAYSDILTCLNQIGHVEVDPEELIATAWGHEIVNRARIEDLRTHHRLQLANGLASSSDGGVFTPSSGKKLAQKRSQSMGTSNDKAKQKKGRKFFDSFDSRKDEEKKHRQKPHQRSEFLHAYYYEEDCKLEITENYWSSRTVLRMWMEHGKSIPEPSQQQRFSSVSVGGGESPWTSVQTTSETTTSNLTSSFGGSVPSIAMLGSSPQPSMNWIQRFEEWHKEKKLEKVEKQRLKKQKLYEKIVRKHQKEKEKNREAARNVAKDAHAHAHSHAHKFRSEDGTRRPFASTTLSDGCDTRCMRENRTELVTKPTVEIELSAQPFHRMRASTEYPYDISSPSAVIEDQLANLIMLPDPVVPTLRRNLSAPSLDQLSQCDAVSMSPKSVQSARSPTKDQKKKTKNKNKRESRWNQRPDWGSNSRSSSSHLRERAQVLSYLQRKASDSNSRTGTPRASPSRPSSVQLSHSLSASSTPNRPSSREHNSFLSNRSSSSNDIPSTAAATHSVASDDVATTTVETEIQPARTMGLGPSKNSFLPHGSFLDRLSLEIESIIQNSIHSHTPCLTAPPQHQHQHQFHPYPYVRDSSTVDEHNRPSGSASADEASRASGSSFGSSYTGRMSDCEKFIASLNSEEKL